MNNLDLYNKVRNVPQEARKSINAGRLKGMTDINPMWRIKTLTEQFGPCGIGWYYEITNQWIEEGSAGQKVAFTNISLYIKNGNDWSRPIQGTGGSSFVTNEKSGPYTSDECFKMSLTDAISVACKALGVGADVYFEKDRTKYDQGEGEKGNSNPPVQGNKAPGQQEHPQNSQQNPQNNPVNDELKCADCGVDITEKVSNFSKGKYHKPLCYNCQNKYK